MSFRFICAAATLLPAVSTAFAADTIKLIVPTGPGGGTDTFFRVIARDAEPLLDASIVIINAGGAGGTIGVGQVVRSAPDGTTLGGVFMGPITVAPHTVKTTYKTDDCIPVIQLKPLRRVGRLLPRPGNATLADQGSVALRQLVELLVQQRGSDLDEAVRTVSTPTHVLVLAHTAPDDPVDRGLNKAG